jgi:hypothetical protein
MIVPTFSRLLHTVRYTDKSIQTKEYKQKHNKPGQGQCAMHDMFAQKVSQMTKTLGHSYT